MGNWIESPEGDEIIFEQGHDPSDGFLRIVGDLDKMEKLDHERTISFKEIHSIVFGKGTSTFICQNSKTTIKGDKIYTEVQYRIAGITSEGRPLLIVITPRGKEGTGKRIVTAWQLSRSSKELKKLLSELPDLKEKIKL